MADTRVEKVVSLIKQNQMDKISENGVGAMQFPGFIPPETRLVGS
jgi:hypothetical protein